MKLSLPGIVILLFPPAQLASAWDSVTFNKDIAPVIFQHCSTCHRPGESGPFPLLSFNDVKKRARQICEVTARGYMPPWLPSGEMNQFAGDRRLSTAEVALFKSWLAAATPEGNPADLPAAPRWTDGWHLGQPDLIVQMPRAFTLPAEGRDIYRNFVLPVSLKQARYVRAVEFRPGNRKIVHHAFVKVDFSGHALKLEGTNAQPGFDGMNLPEGIKMPSGYFLGYQPGKMPSSEPAGYGWTLQPGQNLVVQTHLRPTGKPELLQAQVGLYFTPVPPTNTTMVFALSSLNIDIPASTNCWAVEDDFRLPVDVDLLSVLPHAHYLGKRLEGTASMLDGSSRELLLIPDWDFNWQGDYRYSRSIHLAAGTLLQMRFLYDNSAANVRNPNQPPKEVFYGPQSTDEMGELWFQVRLNNTNDQAVLAQAYNDKNRRMFARFAQFQLQRNPHNARARTELGFIEWADGHVDKALESFRTACNDDPAYDQPHYYMGVIYRTQNRLGDARAEFETAVRLNPKNSKAFGNLAFTFLGLGNLDRAERNVRQAILLDPTDQLARDTLEQILQARNTAKPRPNASR